MKVHRMTYWCSAFMKFLSVREEQQALYSFHQKQTFKLKMCLTMVETLKWRTANCLDLPYFWNWRVIIYLKLQSCIFDHPSLIKYIPSNKYTYNATWQILYIVDKYWWSRQ